MSDNACEPSSVCADGQQSGVALSVGVSCHVDSASASATAASATTQSTVCTTFAPTDESQMSTATRESTAASLVQTSPTITAISMSPSAQLVPDLSVAAAISLPSFSPAVEIDANTDKTKSVESVEDATKSLPDSTTDSVIASPPIWSGNDLTFGVGSSGSAERNIACDSSSRPTVAQHKEPVAADKMADDGGGVDEHTVYHVKWMKFRGASMPIVMQNQNGPCPLLAIVNVLLLQGKIKLTPGTELVASDQLMAYIADWIFDNVPKHITEDTRLNYEQNMHDAIAVFPRLQTGLDVNVKFTGISDFEYTPECIVFDLLDIPLVHGWLVDPNLSHVVDAVGSFSYNQLVERIISNKQSASEAAVTAAFVAEEFLNSTASQLTYHGLSELSASLNEEQLCVLFRNNHFSTIYKHKKELFVLATDQGFLNEPNVVWETLSNVEGDGHFVDVNFHTYRLPEMLPIRHAVIGSTAAAVAAANPVASSTFASPPANSKEQIDHDYLVALSLEQEQSEVGEAASGGAGADVWLGAAAGASTLSDHDLAMKLQREEDLSAAAGVVVPGAQQPSSRPPKPSPAVATGSTDSAKNDKKSECILL